MYVGIDVDTHTYIYIQDGTLRTLCSGSGNMLDLILEPMERNIILGSRILYDTALVYTTYIWFYMCKYVYEYT